MIVRVGKRRRFTIVDNVAVEDPALSFQALGLLVFLLSKPDHWEVSYRHLATVKQGPRAEREHAVRKTLAELEDAGYLERRREQAADGSFTWVSIVYEVPRTLRADPCGDSRGVDNRGRENRGEGKTQGATTDEQQAASHPSGLAASGDGHPVDPGDREPVVIPSRESVAESIAAARAAVGPRRRAG